jgi:hypothetical protein
VQGGRPPQKRLRREKVEEINNLNLSREREGRRGVPGNGAKKSAGGLGALAVGAAAREHYRCLEFGGGAAVGALDG